MSSKLVIDGGMTPRAYQRPYMQAMDAGCKFACWVMHRRGGKDRTALAQTCKMAHRRIGLYWHSLPTLKQARKVVWDGITAEGTNLIAQTFPRALIKRKLEDEMKLELQCGSIIQLVGGDNFDSLVGSNPVHVTFSEWALTDPRAYDFVRPILRENSGSVAFIYTPRGYNHGYKTWQVAQQLPGAFASLMTIRDTGVLTEADIALERALDMPEELIQQEYYCDFSVANVGSIVGRYIGAAETQGRILTPDTAHDPDARHVVSCDLGFRDATAFWWWELRHGGFHLVHYDEATGLDADDWIDRLKATPIRIDHVYLPKDATAKTFQTQHTVVERFSQAFECSVVPQAKIQDRINAARRVLPRCTFNARACARGLDALRAWQFRYNPESKILSAEPEHDWASHGSDAFSYGAQMVRELIPLPEPEVVAPYDGKHYPFTLEELHVACGPREHRV